MSNATDGMDTVRLVRGGHDPVDILPSQVTPMSIARMFSLNPSTVWLREQYGSRAFFPDAMNVKFDLPPDIAHVSLSLIVEGSDPAVPGSRKRISESGNFQQVRKKQRADLSEAQMIHGCPHCCDERVYSVLKRLDDLLASIVPLISNKSEEEEDFPVIALR